MIETARPILSSNASIGDVGDISIGDLQTKVAEFGSDGKPQSA